MNGTLRPDAADTAKAPAPQPWWRYGYVWLLVVAGPLVVVLASFVTFWLAVASPDPVLGETSPASAPRGAEVAQSKKAAIDDRAHTALAPAMQARNHLTAPASSAR